LIDANSCKTGMAGGLNVDPARCFLSTRSELPDNKHLASILNNDIDNILVSSSGAQMTAEEYRRAVPRSYPRPDPVSPGTERRLPDPVIYAQRRHSLIKYLGEISERLLAQRQDSGARAIFKPMRWEAWRRRAPIPLP